MIWILTPTSVPNTICVRLESSTSCISINGDRHWLGCYGSHQRRVIEIRDLCHLIELASCNCLSIACGKAVGAYLSISTGVGISHIRVQPILAHPCKSNLEVSTSAAAHAASEFRGCGAFQKLLLTESGEDA